MSIERLPTVHGIMRFLDRISTQPSLFSLERCSQPLFISAQDFAGVSHELLNLGCCVSFRAPGNSMMPTVSDGERITVRPVSPSDIKPGDIILYRYPGSMVAHRVVCVEKRNGGAPCFILRGDALGAPDEPVEVDQILGKVASVEREGRRIDLYSRKVKIIRMLRLSASHIKRWARNFFDMRLSRRCASRNDRMTQNTGQNNEVQGHNDRYNNVIARD